MSRFALSLSSICIVFALGAGPVAAQLQDVEWNESLNLIANPDSMYSQTGSDPAIPEPLSGMLAGSGYSIGGSVTFASGAPNVTSDVQGSYQSGLFYLEGSAYGRIDFEFAVRLVTTPPISVSSVPVNVHVQGTAGVTGNGDLFAAAWSSVNIATGSGPLGGWMVQVDNSSGQTTDNFNESPQYQLAPDTVVFGDKTASASIQGEGLVPGSSATATAWVDPIIEIADEPIPGGGGASYRDFFDIEFADGYAALDELAIQDATWEEIKQLYR